MNVSWLGITRLREKMIEDCKELFTRPVTNFVNEWLRILIRGYANCARAESVNSLNVANYCQIAFSDSKSGEMMVLLLKLSANFEAERIFFRGFIKTFEYNMCLFHKIN